MRITHIETVPVSIPVDRRVGAVTDTKGFRFRSSLVLVFIHTDCDRCGAGEITASPDWSGETCWGAQALVNRHWAPQLIGEDPRQIRRCLARLSRTVDNPFARAGIELALFDLLGQSLQAPLHQLLGGAVRDTPIPLRFPIMPVSPTKSAEVAATMVAEGFRTIKLKVGHDPWPVDLERLRRVRDAVGADVAVTVDANGAWSVNQAIQAAPALEELGVLFVEQPVHRRDLAGLAEVRRRTRLPIMADEAVFTLQDALQCLQLRAADIISVYPGKNGGLLNTMAIATLAEAAGVHCAIGSNLEWDLGSAAMAHACAALPNLCVERYGADIIGPVFHPQRAFQSSLLSDPSHVVIPQGAGLGMPLDHAAIRAAQAAFLADDQPAQ